MNADMERHKARRADAERTRKTTEELNMNDELNAAVAAERECHESRLVDKAVESLRGDNDRLAKCIHDLRDSLKLLAAERNEAQQQRDELLRVAQNIKHSGVAYCALPGIARELDAAIANCEPAAETAAHIAAAAEYAVSRLDAALERAHDSSRYNTAVAVRDAARSLSGGLAATFQEADALLAELDALAERGGPLDDADDPTYEHANAT